MAISTFIATGLTAFAKLPCNPEKLLYNRPGLLRDYLGVKKQVFGGRVILQPLLVVFEKRLLQKHGWFLEWVDANLSYVGHVDSLYSLQFDERSIAPHLLTDAIHAARTLQREPAI